MAESEIKELEIGYVGYDFDGKEDDNSPCSIVEIFVYDPNFKLHTRIEIDIKDWGPLLSGTRKTCKVYLGYSREDKTKV